MTSSLVFGCDLDPETGVHDVAFIRPADGMTDDCWWAYELHDPKPGRARVKCLDGQVRTANVLVTPLQGTFIDSAVYLGLGAAAEEEAL